MVIFSITAFDIAAVSCSAIGAMLGGEGLVSGTTGKPRPAWVVHGWHRCTAWCLDGVCYIGGVEPEHWGLVLDEVW